VGNDDKHRIRLRISAKNEPQTRLRVTTDERPPSQPSPNIRDRIKLAPVTYGICLTNVLYFLYVEVHGGSTDVLNLVRFGALERSHVWAGEYWRFVTPIFLHIGWVHMGWNTYCLVGWCSPVERVLGSGRFAVTYLIAGIAASATSLLCHDSISAGASGAAFGIVGMTLALRYGALGSYTAFVEDAWVRRTAVTIVVWTIIGLTAVRMDNFAHAGGLLAGMLLGLVFVGGRKLSKAAGRALLVAFLTAFVALIVGAAHRWPGESSVWESYASQPDA
jgi:rhomboid protease GluP